MQTCGVGERVGNMKTLGLFVKRPFGQKLIPTPKKLKKLEKIRLFFCVCVCFTTIRIPYITRLLHEHVVAKA
jgi:hypothetical protein